MLHPGVKMTAPDGDVGPEMRAYLHDLNELYRNHPALYAMDGNSDGFEWIQFTSYDENVVAFLRKTEKQEETTKTDTVCTEQPQTVSETGQAAQPAEQPDKADKTEHSVSTPQPDIPQESETPAPPETEETPSETKTDFDIDYWISFAKGYAQSVGLLLDSEAVYCWDNPIRAGAHCKYLERDIHSRLDRYKADEEITAVWIWAEEVSDGLYDIYIGYA